MICRIIAALLLCASVAVAQNQQQVGWWRSVSAPRSSGTPPALSWWQDTNQIHVGFWSWSTNTTGFWLQDAGTRSITGTPSTARSRVDLGGGAIVYKSVNSTLAYLMSSTTLLNGSTGATIGIWFNSLTNIASAGLWVERSTGGSQLGIIQDVSDTYAGFVSTNLAAASGVRVISQANYGTGIWHSVVLTLQQTATENIRTLYMDGVAVTNATSGKLPIVHDGRFRLGYNDQSASYVFSGFLDWPFVLTNRALTASEISGWHGATYPPTTVP